MSLAFTEDAARRWSGRGGERISIQTEKGDFERRLGRFWTGQVSFNVRAARRAHHDSIIQRRVERLVV